MANTASMFGFSVPDLAGNVQDFAMADMQQQWSRQNTAQAQQYETDMSNTQYQRSVSDELKAGLNPALGFSSGGAGTPTVAAAATPNIQSSNSHVNLADPQQMLALQSAKAGIAKTWADVRSVLADVPMKSSTTSLNDAKTAIDRIIAQSSGSELDATKNIPGYWTGKAMGDLSSGGIGSAAAAVAGLGIGAGAAQSVSPTGFPELDEGAASMAADLPF